MRFFIPMIALYFFTADMVQGQQNIQRAQAQVGLSGVGLLANVAQRVDFVNAIDVNVTPSLQLAYDRFVTKKVSLGVTLAYQHVKVTYFDYQFEEDGETIINDYNTQLTRINGSVRGLFWYNPDSKAKFYSGFRLGVSNWSADTSVPDPRYDIDSFINLALGANIAPQLVIIGSDFAIGSQWNISGELAIGAPYFASIGMSYQW